MSFVTVCNFAQLSGFAVGYVVHLFL